MSNDLQDRSIVVTGATGELGAAVATTLLEAGAVCHLPVRGAAKVGALAERHGDRVRVAEGVDPTDEASVRAFYDGLPRLWASVHCVGAFAMSKVADSTLADVEKLFRVNAASAYLCSREAVRRMRASGDAGGRVVNVAARQAIDPRAGAGAIPYTMSKAAVAALTVALAQEVAAEGIFVNAVAPSLLDTPANRAAMPDADHASWPKLDDVARAIAWLVSPGQTTVQGTIVATFGRA
jgi:NAD(P)-dependent dehydrogenase (short-subunit alcohol dehydrogenase family)